MPQTGWYTWQPMRAEKKSRLAVVRNRGGGNEVALELKGESTGRSIPLRPRQLPDRLELPVEGGVVEVREVVVAARADRAALEHREHPHRIPGSPAPTVHREVERLAAFRDASVEVADRELLHLDVDAERLQVAADDLRLLSPRREIRRIQDRRSVYAPCDSPRSREVRARSGIEIDVGASGRVRGNEVVWARPN